VAYIAVKSGVVLVLELPFPVTPARLHTADHPRAAALALDLSDPGTATEDVVNEPYRELVRGPRVVPRVRKLRPEVQRVDLAPAHRYLARDAATTLDA
jgi:hypothetical protein